MTHTSYSQLLMAPLHEMPFSVPQKHLLYQYLIAEYGGEKMCIRGLQRIGVQNIGVLPEAQGGGPSGWHRQRRGSSGERDFVPRIHGKSEEWELDGGFFAGLILPYSLILLSVLLVSSGGIFPEDWCCLMLLSPPLFSALIMNTADKDRNLSVGKGAKLSLLIWVGLASLGFLFVASLF